MKPNTIIQGDALTKLKELPEESINMCMTSPPYWALRDYGVDNQLGLEPTFDEYINKLCDIFDEVKRVLRKDGTCWVNLGDTYYSVSGGKFLNDNLGSKERNLKKGLSKANELKKGKELQQKNLTSIPFRFAIEMQNRGWILRNTIIWHKPNCMPSSVKDRFTVDFEYLFFFSKQKKYYFETQYEPYKDKESMERYYSMNAEQQAKALKRRNSKFQKVPTGSTELTERGENYIAKKKELRGRNKRTVWKICPKPFKEAHFAVYPEELCETPIKAGCPEFVCKKCGEPKIYFEKKEIIHKRKNNRKDKNVRPDNYERPPNDWKQRDVLSKGYKPTCNCNSDFKSGIVLDPFFGAGTTGLVALKQGKKFVGIELNPEYIKIAQARIKPFLEQEKL